MTRSVVRALGEEVHARRKALRLSQEQLAEKAGVSRNTIGFIERAERAAGVELLKQLADAFGLSLADFFAHVERRMSRGAS